MSEQFLPGSEIPFPLLIPRCSLRNFKKYTFRKNDLGFIIRNYTFTVYPNNLGTQRPLGNICSSHTLYERSLKNKCIFDRVSTYKINNIIYVCAIHHKSVNRKWESSLMTLQT